MKSYKTAKVNLDHIVRLIGPRTKLPSITSHTINVAIAQLKQAEYPPCTINKKVSPLRFCLKYAVEQQWLKRLPTMPFYKPTEGRLRWFTSAEEARMLRWCRAHLCDLLWDYIVVSLDTGLRQSEVLNLKARNVNEGRVTVWGARTQDDWGTKAGNTRVVPLTPRAREVLERLSLDNPGRLFPVSKDQLFGSWQRMRQALGYARDPEFVPHAMRHTFCTRLVKANVNLAVIQKLAGHLRIETTLKYVHLDDDVLVEAIELLNEHRVGIISSNASGRRSPKKTEDILLDSYDLS
ncbi:tyrosine-type recombinase/integrase [Metarhizobium album]|nr:site-specific integrase [Rhizobium album]